MTELLENSPVSAGEDDVRQYLNEIRRYPRLTPEEERELAINYVTSTSIILTVPNELELTGQNPELKGEIRIETEHLVR